MHEETTRRKAASDARAREEIDELALELLGPYRSLTRPGHPLAPVVNACLERPPVEALRLLRRCLAAWPLSLCSTLADLYRHVEGTYDLSDRGLLLLFQHLEDRVDFRLHSGRRRQLLKVGADPGGVTSVAVHEAAVRVRARSDLFTDDLPDSLDRTPPAFRNVLTEAVCDAACPGWRQKRAEVASPPPDGPRNPLEALAAQDAAAKTLDRLAAVLTHGERQALELLAPHLLAGLNVSAAAAIVAEGTGRSAHTVRALHRRARLKWEAISKVA